MRDALAVDARLKDRSVYYASESAVYRAFLQTPWDTEVHGSRAVAALRTAWTAANGLQDNTYPLYQFLLGLLWLGSEPVDRRLELVQYVQDQRWRYYGKPGLAVAATALGVPWRPLDNGTWRSSSVCNGCDTKTGIASYCALVREYDPQHLAVLRMELT